jgi:hypothetical protein
MLSKSVRMLDESRRTGPSVSVSVQGCPAVLLLALLLRDCLVLILGLFLISSGRGRAAVANLAS